MVYNWLKNAPFLRRHCLLCLSPTRNAVSLCSSCEADLQRNEQCCVVCASPFTFSQKPPAKLLCGKCQQSSPYYTTSIIPYIYTSPLKQIIAQFKFHANLTYTPLLANIFTSEIKPRRHWPECIIPMPLHSGRLRERGFNQALEVARLISKKLNLPIDYSVCKRDKATPFQSGLSSNERRQNLKNAFSIETMCNYKHVAIFDDVVTTGTTVNELAKALKKSGVEVVEVWAIARTQSKN